MTPLGGYTETPARHSCPRPCSGAVADREALRGALGRAELARIKTAPLGDFLPVPAPRRRKMARSGRMCMVPVGQLPMPAPTEISRVTAAMVADLIASQEVQFCTLRSALAEVEQDVQQAAAIAWSRGAAFRERFAHDDDVGLGMREPTPAASAFHTSVLQLGRRLLAAERRAAAVTMQRDAMKHQLLLAQRQCSDLLAENAQVHGVNASLNGMLRVLDPMLSAGVETVDHADAVAEWPAAVAELNLESIMVDVYGPQYAHLRNLEGVATLAGEDIDDKIVELL